MKNIKASIGYLAWRIGSKAIAPTGNDIHMTYGGNRL